jgi:hypothetical protein
MWISMSLCQYWREDILSRKNNQKVFYMDWFVGKSFRLSMVAVVCLSVAALVYFQLVQPPKENVPDSAQDSIIVGSTGAATSPETFWTAILQNGGQTLGILGSALTTILSLLSLYWSKREEWARKKLEMKSLDIEHAKMELELQELRKKIANGQSA